MVTGWRAMFDLDMFIADCVAAEPRGPAPAGRSKRCSTAPSASPPRSPRPCPPSGPSSSRCTCRRAHRAEGGVGAGHGHPPARPPHVGDDRHRHRAARTTSSSAGTAPASQTSGGKELRVSDVCLLGDDTIHKVTNPTAQHTGAIHIYGGYLFAIERHEWTGRPAHRAAIRQRGHPAKPSRTPTGPDASPPVPSSEGAGRRARPDRGAAGPHAGRGGGALRPGRPSSSVVVLVEGELVIESGGLVVNRHSPGFVHRGGRGAAEPTPRRHGDRGVPTRSCGRSGTRTSSSRATRRSPWRSPASWPAGSTVSPPTSPTSNTTSPVGTTTSAMFGELLSRIADAAAGRHRARLGPVARLLTALRRPVTWRGG